LCRVSRCARPYGDASVDQVTFRTFFNYTGTSSMEVGIKVVAQNIRSQDTHHVNSCFFTMVAVDDNRKPIAVKSLSPATPDEKRRHAAALARKKLRREFEKRFNERPRVG